MLGCGLLALLLVSAPLGARAAEDVPASPSAEDSNSVAPEGVKPAQASPTQASPTQASQTQSAQTQSNPDQSNSGKPTAAKPQATKPDAAKPANAAKSDTKADAGKPAAPKGPPFDINEYRVVGADSLPQIEVEEAVYPFLGPNRTADDVEKARAALEKAYHDKGYQTVLVSIPQQQATRGFVVLKVTENRVGQLRVKGSRYFDIDAVKKKATSLQEGKLPNFNEVTKDIVALNQQPDRRVTPALRAGVAPGTVDVDLNVEDTVPVHGGVEINNRQSPDTTPLRTSATLHYDNLWQLGHSLSATYQVAPERPKDAEVFSVSYLARTNLDWLSVLVYGLNSASNVATVGGADVIGPGTVVGVRGVISLPSTGEMVQTLSLGVDYKDFGEMLEQGASSFSTPVTYVPAVASYSASWQKDPDLIQLNATLTAGLRGFGSDPQDFDNKRFLATQNFMSLRADLSFTHNFPSGAQLFLKAQGQISDQPLVSSEQFSAGGFDTVRGYLESEVLGDFGAATTVEVRSPNLWPASAAAGSNSAKDSDKDTAKDSAKDPAKDFGKGEASKFNALDEWRMFVFTDAAHVQIFNPLVGQQDQFELWSMGMGTTFKLLKYTNGMVFVAVPMISQTASVGSKPRVSFRLWSEF
jgi:hemolysin activation/secretion protein